MNTIDAMIRVLFFFFFSSRRRHTRSYGDWSSDVCSSDLGEKINKRVTIMNKSNHSPASTNECAARDFACQSGRNPCRLEELRARMLAEQADRKSTRLNSSHRTISYAVFCLKKKKSKPNTH